jgi:lipoyl(octanoyl) transferase
MHEAGRGGDVTYHGPGQLVGYPIFQLNGARRDLHGYLRALEETLIIALTEVGVPSGRSPDYTGVWVGDRKIAAIGVRVSSGWITSHGFALNVDPDLSYFGAIVPCGIPDREVTSVTRELGRPFELDKMVEPLVRAFSQVFAGSDAFTPAARPR